MRSAHGVCGSAPHTGHTGGLPRAQVGEADAAARDVDTRRAHLHLDAMLDRVFGQRDQHRRRAARGQQIRGRGDTERQPRHACGHQRQVGAHVVELRGHGRLGAAVAAQARDRGAQVVHQPVAAAAARSGRPGRHPRLMRPPPLHAI